MVGTHGAIPMEVVGTMIEMADVAWHALDHRKHRVKASPEKSPAAAMPEEELERLRSENLRLKSQLADNLAVLQSIYKVPSFSKDCPTDVSSIGFLIFLFLSEVLLPDTCNYNQYL
jgi:hypothetical protein